MMKDKEKIVYERIRTLKKGSLEQKKIALECEKILSDRCEEESLEVKLEKIIKILILSNEKKV